MIALLTACLFFEILVHALNCISKSARENCVRPPEINQIFNAEFCMGTTLLCIDILYILLPFDSTLYHLGKLVSVCQSDFQLSVVKPK